MSFNLKSLFPYLAGAGASGLSSQFSALAPFSAAIGAGAGALTNSKNRLAGAAQGFAGGGVGSTLAGGVKGLLSGGTGGALDKFGGGAMSGLQSYGNSIPGFGGVGTDNPTGAFAKFFSGNNGSTPGTYSNTNGFTLGADDGSRYSNTSNQIQPPTFTGGAPNVNTPGSNFLNTNSGTGGNTPPGSLSPMDMFKKIIPGAAVAGIGSLLAPQVQAPDYSGVKADLTSHIQNSQNPAALKQYMDTLNTPNGASAEAGVANARLINERQKADALKQIQDQFSANNGSLTGNSAYDAAVTKSNAAYDQNYSAQAAQTQFQYDQQQQQQKMAAANALQGMDDTQLKYYAGLADLDIMQIQEKTGMDVASAQAIKNIASTAGQLLMEKSLGLNGGGK